MSKPKDRYTNYQKIGSGTYGVVYSAVDANTGEKVAIKKLKPEQEDEGLSSTTIREVSLLTELRHPNIISLNEVAYTDGRLHLVFEYLDQDLHQFLTTVDGYVPTKMVKSMLYQLLAGLLHAHEKRVLHRDLKPQNLLINKSGQLKIADFGLARAFTIPCRVYTHEVVTLWYRAPELLLGSRQYSSPLDIWSVGCIFFEMATKEPLFPGECEWGQLMRIFRMLGTPSNEQWAGCETLPDYIALGPKFRPGDWSKRIPNDPKTNKPLIDDIGLDLLKRLLEYDPGERITAAQALQHPYFNEIKAPNARNRITSPNPIIPSRGDNSVLNSLIHKNRQNSARQLAELQAAKQKNKLLQNIDESKHDDGDGENNDNAINAGNNNKIAERNAGQQIGGAGESQFENDEPTDTDDQKNPNNNNNNNADDNNNTDKTLHDQIINSFVSAVDAQQQQQQQQQKTGGSKYLSREERLAQNRGAPVIHNNANREAIRRQQAAFNRAAGIADGKRERS